MHSAKALLLSLCLFAQCLRAQNPPAGHQKATGPHKTGNGLYGEYFNGENFETKIHSRVDHKIDFEWANDRPPGVNPEYFSVRWTGKLYIPESGKYKFTARVDDGIRLWLDGKQIMNEWRRQPTTSYTREVELVGHQLYDLRIEYYNNWRGGNVNLYWEAPHNKTTRFFGLLESIDEEVIPEKYLYSVKPPSIPPRVVKATPVKAAPVAGKKIVEKTVAKLPPQPPVKTVAKVSKPAAKKPEDPAIGNKVEQPAAENFTNLEVGRTIELKNIFFKQSKYILQPESFAELDRLAGALKQRPSVKIEITGHTDNVGDPRLNLALSENRATVVANYLIRKGVTSERITAKGLGGAKPLADNSTEEGRGQNRRVEFVVLEQ